jgi:flagellar basal-body rod protein FlgF
MASGIYVSMTSASARTKRLDAVADNLANADTPGFKSMRSSFEGVLAEVEDRPGIGNDKVMVRTAGERIDRRPGVAVQTSAPLDVLPQEDAFFAVSLEAGGVAYTRDGRMVVDAEGQLLAAGRPVLSAGGAPIVVPFNEVPTISRAGEVLADGRVIDQLALYRLEGDLQRIAPRLLVAAGSGAAESVENVAVDVGVVEQGNVNPVEATVELIEAQRSFDHAMQAIDTYRRMDETANNVGRIR